MQVRNTVIMLTAAVAVVTVLPGWSLPLSPGDRVRVLTPLDDELPPNSRFRISGVYEIDLDGTLQIPFLQPLSAVGLEAAQVEKQLAAALVTKGFFRPEFLELSVNVVQWAPVQVNIAGEIFDPGRVLINTAPDSKQSGSTQPLNQAEPVAGSYPPGRYLTVAIRSAGGLKPTADIRNIRLIRGKQEKVIDLSGVFTGQATPDVPLIAGDRVVVPKALLPDQSLVRPSQITPTQVPVLLSNLTEPKSSRGGGEVVDVEYGTRFSQSIVAAGCAGGSRSTNARRRAVLVQTDRLTGQTQLVDRSVEQLLKDSNNNTDNPFLMPLDSVVCYDSSVTNVSRIFRLITDVLSPFFLIPRLFRNE